MDKFIASVLLLGVMLLGMQTFNSFQPEEPIVQGSGTNFFYTSSSMASSSVSIYSWSTVLAADQSRGYVSFCNDRPTAGTAIYLGMGATTTFSALGMAGIKLGADECYDMTLDKMFYGNVYAIASSATSTLLTVKASY